MKINRQKKAQMEAIGLVFIVLLLSLGIFFMLYNSNKDQKTVQDLSPQNIDLHQIMIDAIKNIKLDCQIAGSNYPKRIPIDDIIQDVAVNYPHDYKIYCYGDNSKIYLEKSLYNLFNVTLIAWSKPFVFKIEKGDEELIKIINPDPEFKYCTDKASGPVGSQTLPIPISKGGGKIEISLHLCDLKR